MNEFLREIHTMVFQKWVLTRHEENVTIQLNPENTDEVLVETQYAKGILTFHNMGIIELRVDNMINGENEFYLHFQMNTFDHAIELYHEMIDCIQNISEKPVLKVLLSCSSGLTTYLYAEKLNEAAKVLDLNYEFEAVAITELVEEGPKHDVILLAPQVAYQYNRINGMMKNRLVLKIPPQIFAKYDAGKGITFLQEELEKYRNTSRKQNDFDLSFIKHEKDVILSIGLIQSQSRSIMRLLARVYDQENNILKQKETRRKELTIEDIYDMIDSILPEYPQISIISLAVPGIINDGKTRWTRGFDDVNIVSNLKERYNKMVALNNDINAVVTGYYLFMQECHNMAFIYQPVNANAGIGIIQNDRLIAGHKNIAGEIKHVPLDLSDDWKKLSCSEEGTMEIMGKLVATTIAMTGVDLIVYYSELVPDVEALKQEVTKYIPEEYLPEIIKSYHMSDYILPGSMVLGLTNLQ